jgi:long-chain fatty acid transport protein
MSKRTPIIILAAVLALTSLATGNGLNLNGLGTRAQSMGGAYVSLANDFSAVFWNPAGAAGFRKEMFGFYATDLIPRATYRYESPIPEVPLIDAKTDTSHYLGFLGAYYRPIGSKVIVGFGFGTPSSQGIVWDGSDFAGGTNDTAYDLSRKTTVFSFSPLVAVRLNEWLSVGAALNINLGTFGLKKWGGTLPLGGEGEHVDIGQYEESMTGWGFGATFGVLANPIEKLGIGIAVRTPSTISYNGTARLSYYSLYGLPDSSDLKRKITWPLWIAGGVSFRPVERLLLSADVQWTQWSKLAWIRTDYLEPAWPVYYYIDFHADSGNYPLYQKDVTQIRFGAEYLLNATTALRAGYYNDPKPGSPLWDLLFPGISSNAVSIGVGKSIGDLQLDFGLEYLTGKRTQGYDWFLDAVLPETYKMNQVIPSVSVQYKF